MNAERLALEEGRFIGQVILQLGGKNSPAMVPLTTEMPRDLVGKVRLGEKATGDTAAANLVTRVLNVTGKDIVTATYNDERRPEGKAEKLAAQGRLISNGMLAVTDREYDKAVTQLARRRAAVSQSGRCRSRHVRRPRRRQRGNHLRPRREGSRSSWKKRWPTAASSPARCSSRRWRSRRRTT